MLFILVACLSFPIFSSGCPGNITVALRDREAVKAVSTYMENLNDDLKNKKVSTFSLEDRWASMTFGNEHADQLFCEFRNQMKGVSSPNFGWFACAGCKAVFFSISLLDFFTWDNGVGEGFVKKFKPIFNGACENFDYLPGVSDFCAKMSLKINVGLTIVQVKIKQDGGQIKPGPICDRLSTFLGPGQLC